MLLFISSRLWAGGEIQIQALNNSTLNSQLQIASMSPSVTFTWKITSVNKFSKDQNC